MLLLSLACTLPPGAEITGKPDTIDSTTDSTGSTDDTDDSGGTGGCPVGMALAGSACVDRYEAAIIGWSAYQVPDAAGLVAISQPGLTPQGYTSGEQAAAACAAAGKRLCTSEEWLRACQGPDGRTFPYGETYDATACNVTRAEHPVISYFGTADGVWDSEHMNDPGINQQPDTVDTTGANTRCVTAEGHFDMHGNLHEWVADADGTFRGGFYADASINGQGCLYTTTAHDFSYHDYSTGFRCCQDGG